jgi:transaldolase
MIGHDVRWACDVLRPVYNRTGGVDGRVSIEADPRVAHDPAKTVAEARALQWLIARPDVMMIPATDAGLGAITAATAEGISVNVTLVFGLKRYAAGGGRLPRRARAGRHHRCRFDDGPICRISLCLTRGHGDRCALEQDSYRRGPSAARQIRDRLCSSGLQALRSGDRVAALAAAGSTRGYPPTAAMGIYGSQEPGVPDTMYVTELVTPDTVNTMPEATLDAVADHPRSARTPFKAATRRLRLSLRRSPRDGVDYDDVMSTLERVGVQRFVGSWNALTCQSPGGPVRQEQAAIPDAVEIIIDPDSGTPPDC